MQLNDVCWDDPKPRETPTEYFNRVLGQPGSIQRSLTDGGIYQYYLMIWDAYHRNSQPSDEVQYVH